MFVRRWRPYALLVPTTSQLLAFALASILFIQVPGPSLLFTIGRALTVGRRAALLSVLGNALGLIAQILAVALGLGAIVAASAAAYTVLKIVGAALGRLAGHPGDPAPGRRADRPRRCGERHQERTSAALRTGFIVGATNPKTIVFFVAFLPQFTNASAGHVGAQVAFLGALFAVMAVASDSVWALAASRARDWFARKPQRLDAMGATGGVMMIGLGATLAATD